MVTLRTREAMAAWLEQLAAAVPPGARGLTARLAPADAWTWAHWQPPFPSPPTAGTGEQARAIQEAAAYSTRLTAGLISEMPGLGAWHTVVLTGGAARGTLWPQILADMLGGPVSLPITSSPRPWAPPSWPAAGPGSCCRAPRPTTRRRPAGRARAPGGWRTRARPGSRPMTCSMNGGLRPEEAAWLSRRR